MSLSLDRAVTFMSRLSIRTKDGDIVPFKLNRAQHVFIDALRKREREGGLTWAIVLKARRVGISTVTEGLLTAHCFATPNARVRIIAHKSDSSKALFDVAKRMRNSVRAWMPESTQRLLTYPHTDAEMQIQTAGSSTTGRGLSLSAVHFSEAAYYEGDAQSLISVLPAVPKRPGTIVVIESTANGKSGLGQTFFDYWIGAMEGKNAFVPIFIPWTSDPDCVADEELAEDAPADSEEELLMASGVTRAQIAWRRLTIETECRGLPDFFRQEYPRTWEEAFLSTGNPAFNQVEREYASRFLNPPFKIKPTVFLSCERDSKDPKSFSFFEDPKGIAIWERPKRDPIVHRYYIGVDVARGKTLDDNKKDDSDYSCLVVWNGTTGDQAARYAERIDPFKLADICDMVGREYNNALVIIELTGGFGAWTQKTMRDTYHYPNLYRWKGSKDDSMPGKTMKQALGWETTYASRKQLMAAFRESLRYQKIRIFDEQLIAQIEAATYDEDWRWELEVGHDDILMAAMLCNIAMHQYPPPSRLGSKIIDPDHAAAEDVAGQMDEHPMRSARFTADPRYALIRHYRKIRRKRTAGMATNRLVGI